MLRFSEEILLLALDDATGKLHPLPERAIDFATVGALLMELAFANRVDTCDKELNIIDRSPTGDALLDAMLATLPADIDTLPIANALTASLVKATDFRQELFDSLKTKGILKQEDHRFLWVMHERRYPLLDETEEAEVKSRIRDVILNEAIPDPRDVVIICLMHACDLSQYVFSEQELERVRPRIEQVSKMDFIGQALATAIQRIQQAILESIAYMGM